MFQWREGEFSPTALVRGNPARAKFVPENCISYLVKKMWLLRDFNCLGWSHAKLAFLNQIINHREWIFRGTECFKINSFILIFGGNKKISLWVCYFWKWRWHIYLKSFLMEDNLFFYERSPWSITDLGAASIYRYCLYKPLGAPASVKRVYYMIILCMCPANERCRYIVTASPMVWAYSQNDSCS